jgi:hypothetical protein
VLHFNFLQDKGPWSFWQKEVVYRLRKLVIQLDCVIVHNASAAQKGKVLIRRNDRPANSCAFLDCFLSPQNLCDGSNASGKRDYERLQKAAGSETVAISASQLVHAMSKKYAFTSSVRSTTLSLTSYVIFTRCCVCLGWFSKTPSLNPTSERRSKQTKYSSRTYILVPADENEETLMRKKLPNVTRNLAEWRNELAQEEPLITRIQGKPVSGAKQLPIGTKRSHCFVYNAPATDVNSVVLRTGSCTFHDDCLQGDMKACSNVAAGEVCKSIICKPKPAVARVPPPPPPNQQREPAIELPENEIDCRGADHVDPVVLPAQNDGAVEGAPAAPVAAVLDPGAAVIDERPPPPPPACAHESAQRVVPALAAEAAVCAVDQNRERKKKVRKRRTAAVDCVDDRPVQSSSAVYAAEARVNPMQILRRPRYEYQEISEDEGTRIMQSQSSIEPRLIGTDPFFAVHLNLGKRRHQRGDSAFS